jgi:hypothetical protein
VGFIPLITESGSIMFGMTKEKVEEKKWLLSPLDRCDRCNAEALVKVTGITGDLMFCGHHYNKIMAIPDGYNSMMSFMISVIDERDKLIENKSKDNDYLGKDDE